MHGGVTPGLPCDLPWWDSPTPDTRKTATQMATPSIHSPFSRCEGMPAPRPVEICREQNFVRHKSLDSFEATPDSPPRPL